MIYLYCKNKKSPGISVILNNLGESLLRHNVESKQVDDISILPSDAVIWPYGPRESYELMATGRPLDLCLLIDYYSFGCKNKFFFYLRNGCWSYRDLYYSVFSYFRYHNREMAIIKAYKKVVLVSQKDIDALKKDTGEDKFLLLRNGVCLDRKIKQTNSVNLRLGIISHWTKVSVDETRWFVNGIFPHLESMYPNIKLIIAGKGDQELAKKYFANKSNVEFIGEVEELDTFFANLDIYVATVPKGCGVLNKVLDAFSYKVFTIGIPASFSGFSDLKDGYIECKETSDYINAIDTYLNNYDMIRNYVANAFTYISKYHNWDVNYDEFVQKNVMMRNLK